MRIRNKSRRPVAVVIPAGAELETDQELAETWLQVGRGRLVPAPKAPKAPKAAAGKPTGKRRAKAKATNANGGDV